MSNKIQTPFPLFSDINGLPLDEGFIYIGETGKDPEVYPVPVFWDENLTIPAEQPVRTHNGYLSYYDAIKNIYTVNDRCSISIRNKDGNLVATNLDADVMFSIKDKVGSVNSISDLKTYSPVVDNHIVYVNEIGKHYTYYVSTSEIENGITSVKSQIDIGSWLMEIPDAYYASWFAKPNEIIDQSLKLQLGHDFAVSKNRPYIIDGVFYVEANQYYMGVENNSFIVRDNAKITFLPEAKFIQINQNKNQTNIILCMRNKNFTIISPKLIGDRLENTSLGHTSDAQGFGYGLTLYEAENGFIFEPQISQSHGDNIYIGKPWGSNQNLLPKNITIVRPNCDHARRNCIALTAWDGVKIIDPVLSYAGDSDGITGAFPKSCIDIELENAEGFSIAQGYNGIITNPKCLNANNGVFFYCSYDDRSFDIHIQGDLVLNGITTIGLGMFHGSNNCTGMVKIDNIKYLSSMYQEIVLAWHKNSNLKVEIDHIYPIANDKAFEIASLNNGSFSTKVLGNVTINNIHTIGFTPFICDVGADYKVDGYRFYVANDGKNGITYFTNKTDSQASLSGKDTFIDSKDNFIHSGFSASSIKMPNEIWHDPSISSSDANYIMTANDFRVLKIGLDYNTSIIGNGCNINGLNLLIDGVTKTQAKTLTLGGWIKLQNMSGGRTKILDSFGTWIFS
ncbi:hypothetical protein [Acinetobacter sp. ABJ-A23_2]|uniref:hypothetical protein n=1 Tax=Acinetobacter sp. ABJ-A23_2 TaxID=3376991 RepID=UPI0037C9C0E6